MSKRKLPDDPNYRVEGLPPSLRAKTTYMIKASMDYAFIGTQMPEDFESITEAFLGARYDLERTIMTKLGNSQMAKVTKNFHEIMTKAYEERDAADKSAGAAWRLLRRYKYRVRQLILEKEADRALLEKIKQCCLFGDDDGSIGVTEDPHIPFELFDEICKRLE